MNNRISNYLIILPAGGWILVFFILPLASVFVYSFLITRNYSILFEFTLINYIKALTESIYVDVTIRTLRISILTTLISLLIAYPIAYYLARRVYRYRIALLMLVIMPLWTSYLVRTFAWLLILGRNGIINQTLVGTGLADAPIEWLLYSEVAVVVALVHIYMPFMVLPIFAVLERFDEKLLEAAYDLGAGRIKSFFTITLPLSRPGIVAGCIFVFVPAMGAYVTPEIVGGTDGLMLGNIIAKQFGGTFEFPFGSALTILMVGVVAIFAITVFRLNRVGGG
jgi:spermidine/putrescine transport system permease protein